MTDYTDGSSFVGVDATAYAADEAAGAWIDQRVMSNSKWLSVGRDAATCTFTTHNTSALTTYTGTRPLTGVGDWNSIIAFPILLRSGLSGVTIVLNYLAYTFGATQNDIKARFRIRGESPAGAETEFTLAETTGGGGPEFKDHTQTITFDEPWKGEDVWATAIIEIKGEKGDSYSTETLSSTYIGQRQYYASTSANGEITPNSSGPATDSYEVKMMVDSQGAEFELLAIDPNSTNPEKVYYWPNDFGPYVGADVTMYDVGFVCARSISFQLQWEDTSISRVGQGDLQANVVALGLDGYDQGNAIKRFSSRPKLLTFGPPGVIYNGDETWPSNYAKIWTFQTGSGSDQMDALIDESLFIDRETPKIKIQMLVCASLLTPSLSNTATGVGLSFWDISAQLSQLQDGDTAWTSASYAPTATAINAAAVQTHAANATNGRMLYQMALASTFADFTTPTGHMFMYRDGQLLDPDFDRLHMLEVEMDLTDFDTESTLPVRLEVTASLDSVGDLPFLSDFTTSYQNARLRLWCVGYSIWSVVDG